MKMTKKALLILVQTLFLLTSVEAFQPFLPSIQPRHYLSTLRSATIDTTNQDKTEETAKSKVKVTEDNAFDLVAGRAYVCLLESDIRRDAIGKGASIPASSATNWINDASAFALQKAFDKVKLKLADERTGMDRDEASSWIRWMKNIPSPAVVNLSKEFQAIVNETISDKALDLIDQRRSDFLSRVACRLILLPSGSELPSPLLEPAASIIFGKLLYGGVTRYRLLVSSNSRSTPPRKAGVRTEVKPVAKENIPAWLVYGGPGRMYEAVDMGPAAVLEVALLPRGKTLSQCLQRNMMIDGIMWKPQNMFDFYEDDEATNSANGNSDQNMAEEINGKTPWSLSGKERNEAFQTDFRSAVGGLQPQIDAIVRRVLDGRVIRPAEDDSAESGTSGDAATSELSVASLEAEELALLGLSPVRGLLLHGPPGCGKTALAREISRALRARAPKIVSAPELLDRWVGGSEKLVRALFADAEAELAACNGDATKSALHVVVIDEIDAVFRKRSSAEDSGEATRSSVVNQILAKLDGVNAIPNVLLIGMTNRRELLDEALLRPGRLEVQIKIPLPDREGRREILQIHFGPLRERGRLSMPLCRAIDGVSVQRRYKEPEISIKANGDDTATSDYKTKPVKGRKRKALKRVIQQAVDGLPAIVRPGFDLAGDFATGGFSGADIAGLVRCAGSIALSRARKDGSGVDGLLITLEDVKQALIEVKR